jgi:DNA-binding transcriptional LysR family regulator
MELRHLEIFCKIVELKSFSKAADALYLTQPTLSSHIKALESTLDTRLLDRLGREVIPTKAGSILYSYAKEIVRLKKEAKQALNQFLGKIAGSLDIGGSNIPGVYILPSLLCEFKRTYPDISVTLKIGDTKEIAEMILEGKVEIGVVGARIEDSTIENSEFLKDFLILVAPQSYNGGKISKKGLKEVPLIFREKGSGSRLVLEKTFAEHGIDIADLNIVAELGSTEAVKQAVKSGLGLSVLSKRAVQDELVTNVLKEVKTEYLSIHRSFYIITHKQRVKSPLCETFLEFLKKKT